MTRNTITRSLQNFLFMLPASASPTDENLVSAAAKKLTSCGYVYVASSHEKDIVDRDNVRYMPFHPEALPNFGTMTQAFVLRDEDIARAAREAYPGAEVSLIDPANLGLLPSPLDGPEYGAMAAAA